MERGIANPTNRALRVPRNMNRTITTKMILMTMLFSRLLSCISTISDWSLVIVYLRSSGKRWSSRTSFRISLIFLVADSRFSPPFLTICRDTTGLPFRRVKLDGSSYPSTTSATSRKYMIFPFSLLTIMSSRFFTLSNSPRTRTVFLDLPVMISPADMDIFS